MGKRPPRLPAFVCAAFLLLAGCHKQAASPPAIKIEHEIAPQPARVGEATITLRLTDESAKPVTGAQITIEGNMSHAGMGPAFGKAIETTTGQYRAPLDLSMAGDWLVTVHLTLANGEKLERQFDVRGVRPN